MNFFRINPKKNGCCVSLCRNQRQKGYQFCRRCRDRRYKIRSPASYARDKLKYNAKRRGKAFNISIVDFKKFCEETGYLEHAGRMKMCASIDRKDPSKGYVLSNMQVITVQDNSRKQHIDAKISKYYTDEEYPF